MRQLCIGLFTKLTTLKNVHHATRNLLRQLRDPKTVFNHYLHFLHSQILLFYIAMSEYFILNCNVLMWMDTKIAKELHSHE